MQTTVPRQPDSDQRTRLKRRGVPLSLTVFAPIGIQGKLIASFLALLLIGFGGSSSLFVQQSHSILEQFTIEQETSTAGVDLRMSRDLARRETIATLRQVQQAIIRCNALAAILSVPVVFLLVNRIFSPIHQLVVAADRIAGGDLKARVAIDRTDVIGMLARSFNEMASRVRQHQAELEQKVQQRTTQLQAANRRLNEEIAEKEEFLRAVSHDLTAPLRNIAGMTSMLLLKKREVLDEEAIHRLERIAKNVEVEHGLIGELMELSKIKSGQRRMANFDMGVLVRDTAGVFESELLSKNIRFEIDTVLPVLHCERARMRQIFQNLFDNAIKYMGNSAGEPADPTAVREIHVGCIAREEEIEFYVADTGIGIDLEDQATIFNVFQRGRGARAASIAGKGVGLATAKTIVETYGGIIGVESEVGKGSKFRFTINEKYFARPRKLVEAA